MFDECPGCGGLHTDMAVDSAESVVVCPTCGHQESIHREPLLIVSGAGGTGKSTVLNELRGTRDDAVLLDSDVLWRDEFWDDFEWYFQTWLRLCRDIAQSNRPPVLFGAGFGVPENLEAHPQYDCFSAVEYLVLLCDEDEQRQRLQARPPERHPDRFEITEENVTEQVEFNQWLKDNAECERDAVTTIDTTDETLETTAKQVDEWITTQIEAHSD
ncbi:ATP-binding protein [Natronolimnobius sp. AArcel1]|uniref:AAA family ATPase n=1 Tax=Natronolimnobius sp. AArcel1 TaxID=1679093 RepID=UPI0013ED0EBD|nr:AAA family ATPase [Natronolimnobius sp. AArcel1]NGM67827.1 ATP-binding protein [Natronolimnobius sp. AArcel1]